MSKSLRILNVLGFLVMIGANAVANIVPLNDVTTGEISEKYPNIFTPADFTFAIWGLIYFSLFIFVIYQLTKGSEKTVSLVGILFFFSTILNSTWIVLWHYDEISLSLITMAILLLTLIAIYVRINKERYGTSLICVRLPFNIYLAWISIATVANITVFLKRIGWDMFGMSQELWMVIVLVVVLLITSLMLLKRKDILFSMVVMWALAGIFVRHMAEYERNYPYVIGFIVFMFIVIIIENIYNLYKVMSK